NRSTGTGASPVPLAEGDRFTLHATIPTQASEDDLKSAEPDRSRSVAPISGEGADSEALKTIQQLAFDKAGSGGSAYTQAEKLAEFLRASGAYSDGGPDAQGPSKVPAGHSIARLNQFLTAAEPVGNAEQYAAAMALMAQQLGLPARVVMGFKPDKSGNVTLTGKDVDAWVEIAFEGFGWVPFDPTPDEDKKPKDQQQQQALPEELAQQEAPPPTYLEPPDTVPDLANQKARKRPDQGDGNGFHLPAIVIAFVKYVVLPILVLVAIVAAIAFVKRLRMKRRRTRGSSIDRVQGAWLEAVDHLRDLGHRPPTRSTRRELAHSGAAAAWPTALPFAQQIDAVMFGPVEPDDEAAAAVWEQADQEFAAMRKPLGRRARLKASISLASLRPRRR
ncbi:MAG: transglutaminase-like domain-containing protein, partial [Aquihabitans sp.]